MRVAVAASVLSDLPAGVSTVVLADRALAGVFYACDAPLAKRCADASAALTAIFEAVIETEPAAPGNADHDGNNEPGDTGP